MKLSFSTLLGSSSGSDSDSDSIVGGRSICIVLSYDHMKPNFCGIVQLDPLTPEMIKNKRKKIYAKWMAHLSLAPDKFPPLSDFKWLFSPPSTSSDDLYLLPDWPFTCPTYVPLYGATFNCTTNTFQPIKHPPNAPKLGGFAVTVKQDVFFMANPSWYDQPPLKDMPDAAVFERYVPANQSWVKEVPFPDDVICRFGYKCLIRATAVWDDTILLNIGGCEIWAYHVSYRKWYHVNVLDDKWASHGNRCYDIMGQALVVKNSIYSLTKKFQDLVLAFSIEKKGDGCDLEYTCSFRAQILLRPMVRYLTNSQWNRTRYLVHMGLDMICLVRTAVYSDSVKSQPIELTYIKLREDGQMDLAGVYPYWVKLHKGQQFHIDFCFTQPECKTPASKPCETFIFNPFEGLVSKQEDKTDFNPETEIGNPVQKKHMVTLTKDGVLSNAPATSGLAAKSNVVSEEIMISDVEGCSVVVMNLPPDATARQLTKGLKKFGHLKLIQLVRDTMENCCVAFVDFESATSKRHAIEASPIRIGGCSTYILELRGTSLAKVDSLVKRSSKNRKRKRC